jgi:hypothetical protein
MPPTGSLQGAYTGNTSQRSGVRLLVFPGAYPLHLSRSHTMSKSQHSNKETKKQPLLTPKEKKAAKQHKKHAGDAAPLIVKGS